MRLLATLLTLMLALPALAATTDPVEGQAVTARLITAEDGVSGATLSAGLALEMEPGWKTYWRTPGQVGLPPELDWSGSQNIADIALSYPAPERFVAFDIENYGYGEEVVFPLAITLENPDAPARLAVEATLLVCAEICIPETVSLSLDLPVGGTVDRASADLLARWIERVPGETGFTPDAVHLDDTALTLRATAEAPLSDPQVFPEHGEFGAFGPPDIRVDGRTLWARLPVTGPGEGPLDVTLVDGERAMTFRADLATTAPAPPASGQGIWTILAFALLGGFILNAMPCVLPVLSLKLASALQARDRALAEVRLGFLAAASGVIAFFATLALVLIGLRAAGVAVGWGVQFQQPAFLAVMVVLMILFAASLWGLWEAPLPSGVASAMGRAGGTGLRGDFATGAFAAVMATPCSAPFIGTAVAYALTSGAGTTLAVFLAMGAGLALPYLAVAARPGLVRRLPRPGPWMASVKAVLGGLLALAALWLLSVLWASAGPWPAVAVAAVAVAVLAALSLRRRRAMVAGGGLAAAILAAILVPGGSAPDPVAGGDWVRFDPARIEAEVAGGEVVFVDVTADWCLTCKANKRLVLDSAPVTEALQRTVAMRGDWTRPDPQIASYLESHGRYGIPFNAVYGPGAPEGVALPEILTEAAVLEALAAVR
ncbi:protein-disulfide reductase DsbD family protein [Jannaschia aquimarina]|uniref:DsbD protein n=1 Tax=Jannaschia aquimarina TaxID=935700 RepID=A0A0D1EKX0_9RHOB|nr:protein-disulfide reductase DsbD domain-containing protein [Jannaschia aquimarina]KIT16380.1 Thiol:disulfide interchange protein DsbD precursor [Jannaschia aquimarina]SNT05208.1 suppressor for copper-sensitivity B [Jannaschia aquimarina]